jgi:hypothetical protein
MSHSFGKMSHSFGKMSPSFSRQQQLHARGARAGAGESGCNGKALFLHGNGRLWGFREKIPKNGGRRAFVKAWGWTLTLYHSLLH